MRLKIEVRGASFQFFYALGQGDWTKIGPVLDASTLSDERGAERAREALIHTGLRAPSPLGGRATMRASSNATAQIANWSSESREKHINL